MGPCGHVLVLQSAASDVQGFPSSQFKVPVGSQTRGVFGLLSSSLQRSPGVHAAPSSQGVSWALLVCLQPVAGSQLSSVH
jgi:hypothetical protein